MKHGGFWVGLKNFISDHPLISALTFASLFGATTNCISTIHQANVNKNMPPEYWEAQKAQYEAQKCDVRIE